MEKPGVKNIAKIGLVAGEGLLPVHVARNAANEGIEVVTLSISRDNRRELKELSEGRLHKITPGLFEKNMNLLRSEDIRHIVFAGKVNKWLLFRDPRMDARAMRALTELTRRSDDGVMLGIISILSDEGFEVVAQTRFLQDHFLPEGLLTRNGPTAREQEDIRYGLQIAKEMGRLDVGQTIVVGKGMILAVEAIEGTDECLKRAGKWSRKKGGVVVKVAKPGQDQRFDVPVVGLRTLKAMRRAGLRVLAAEANETLFLDPDEMTAYADRHDMVITSVKVPEKLTMASQRLTSQGSASS